MHAFKHKQDIKAERPPLHTQLIRLIILHDVHLRASQQPLLHATGHTAEGDEHDGVPAAGGMPQASDELGSMLVITSKSKLKSFVFNPAAAKGALGQLALGLANNSVEVRVAAVTGTRCCRHKVVTLQVTTVTVWADSYTGLGCQLG